MRATRGFRLSTLLFHILFQDIASLSPADELLAPNGFERINSERKERMSQQTKCVSYPQK